MRKNYTLVELLVVIIIIGILAGLVIPAVGSARQRARESSSAAGCATLMQALKSFETDYQKFPVDLWCSETDKTYTPIGGGVQEASTNFTYEAMNDSDSSATVSTKKAKYQRVAYDRTMSILTGYIGGASSVTETSDFGRNKKKIRYIEPPESYLKKSELITSPVYENGFYANAFGERYWIVWDSNGYGKLQFNRPYGKPSETTAGAGKLDDNYETTVVASVGVFCSLATYDTTTGSPWVNAERIATSWAGVIANNKTKN